MGAPCRALRGCCGASPSHPCTPRSPAGLSPRSCTGALVVVVSRLDLYGIGLDENVNVLGKFGGEYVNNYRGSVVEIRVFYVWLSSRRLPRKILPSR